MLHDGIPQNSVPSLSFTSRHLPSGALPRAMPGGHPACALPSVHSRNTSPKFQESLLSGSPVVFWSCRLLSPQDWPRAYASSDTPPLRRIELPNASLLQPERSRRVCSSSCALLRHSLGYTHFFRLFFFFFKDFSHVSGGRSPLTLLEHYAAWPEGLSRACASTPKAENPFSCGELGMSAAFFCLTAPLL